MKIAIILFFVLCLFVIAVEYLIREDDDSDC